MKSIKPGRGPSAMGALGSVFVAFFGIVWTVAATNMGAPIFFTLFGIIFVLMAAVQGFYNYNNATNKNRMSEYDITDEHEEPDPLQARFNRADHTESTDEIIINDAKFCPYCGAELNETYRFCPECGKRIKE